MYDHTTGMSSAVAKNTRFSPNAVIPMPGSNNALPKLGQGSVSGNSVVESFVKTAQETIPGMARPLHGFTCLSDPIQARCAGTNLCTWADQEARLFQAALMFYECFVFVCFVLL
jgi:hypothetical protein